MIDDRAASASRRPTRAARSRHERARGSLFGGVPMPWMMLWAGGYPVAVAEASGSRVTCVDGVEFVDLCLGRHGRDGRATRRAPVLEALRAPRGITTMLPTEDAAWVGEELRAALRAGALAVHAHRHRRQPDARCGSRGMLTGRPKVLVYSYCYHGSVDEAFAVAAERRHRRRGPGTSARRSTSALTTTRGRVQRPRRARGARCATGDDRLRAGRAGDDEHGHRAARRRLPRGAARADARARDAADHRRDAHVLAPGRAGARAAWGLEPDLLDDRQGDRRRRAVRGARARRRTSRRGCSPPTSADFEDTGGVGGTLAGNALSLAAMRATLGEVLTDDVWEHTIPLAARFADGVREAIGDAAVERHAARLPRRVPLQRRAGAQRHRGPRGARTPSSSATCTCTRSTAAC